MSFECVSSNLCSDVRCAVCGQGFLVSMDRLAPFKTTAQRARVAVRTAVQQALRLQCNGTCSHPAGTFQIHCAA